MLGEQRAESRGDLGAQLDRADRASRRVVVDELRRTVVEEDDFWTLGVPAAHRLAMDLTLLGFCHGAGEATTLDSRATNGPLPDYPRHTGPW
jgi:hypothetical protein